MTKRNIFTLLLLFVFVLTAACSPISEPEPTLEGKGSAKPVLAPVPGELPDPKPIEKHIPDPPPDWAAETLAALTTGQKISQLLVVGIDGLTPGADAVTAIQTYQVGGIILFSYNVESAGQLVELTNGLKALNGERVPLFLCIDQEGGRVDRMPRELARTPSAYTIGKTGSASKSAAFGTLLAAECAAFGLNVDFAPCLDIWSNPRNTVIGDRAFGTDWETAAELGSAALDAMRAQGNVIPVVKHFPGHGDTLADSHTSLPVVDKSLDELWQSELLPFSRVLSGKNPAPAVMVAHILMTRIDPDRPASLSPAVVTDLLRGDLGFEGVVCTDDLTMGAISNSYGRGEAAVLALEAGCDLLLICDSTGSLTEVHDALAQAVGEGRISQARLDESVYRILSLKREYNVSSTPSGLPDIERLNTLLREVLAD